MEHEKLGVQHDHLTPEAKNEVANLICVAQSMGEVVEAYEIQVCTLEVCLTARTAQGRQVTYTHDIASGGHNIMVEDECTGLRLRLSDEGRKNS